MALSIVLILGSYLFGKDRTTRGDLQDRLQAATVLSVAAAHYADQTGHYPSCKDWPAQLEPVLALMARGDAKSPEDASQLPAVPEAQALLKRQTVEQIGEHFTMCPALDGAPAAGVSPKSVVFYEADANGQPVRRSGRTVVAYAHGAGAEAVTRFKLRAATLPAASTRTAPANGF